MVTHILIIANWNKPESHPLAAEISRYIISKGLICSISITSDDVRDLIVPPGTDLAISLGGDGTVLYCARFLHDLGIPIMAVNLGTFGYITEVGKDEWKEELELFLAGKTKLSRRLMIRVEVVRQGRKVFQCHGLNEMVVTSSGISKVVNLSVNMDGVFGGVD